MDILSTHTKSHLCLLRDSIVDVLTSLHCVSGIGLFGSLASDSWDEWSDIDLVLACDDSRRSAFVIVAEINVCLPMMCHRPFSVKDSPNGRYWFEDHSPFHKLDVSFHDQADWDKVVNDHQQEGNPMRCLACSSSSKAGDAPRFLWEYTSRQKDLFDIVHRVHRYKRAYVRSGTDVENLSHELASMQQFMDENPPRTEFEKRAWIVAEKLSVLAKNNPTKRCTATR